MAGMITRCPKCATAFRISEAHLQSAKGMVRCGNCLNVFNARENIQNRDSNQNKEASTKAPAAQQATGKAPAAKVSKTEASKTEAPAKPKRSLDATKTQTATPEQKPTHATIDSDTQKPTVQKSRGIEERPKHKAKAPEPAPPKSFEPSLGGHHFDDHDDDDEDESWALELLKDDSDLNIKLKKIVTPEDKLKEQQKQAELEAESTPEIDAKTNSLEEPAPSLAPPPAAAEPKQAPINDMLAAIATDPLEVEYEDQAARAKKRRLWGALCAVAALFLFVQVAWLEFYRLSKHEPYRSYYAMVCPILGCTLPELKDRKAIATTNLMVRTHPNVENALMVDVILENKATFEQKFPGILLTFSNLQNEPVAVRRFGPSEYLGGELAGSTHMPVNQPIHVAIELEDPGTNALSYSVAIID